MKPGVAKAEGPQAGQGGSSLRGYTYCNLRSGLGVKQGDRILDVRPPARSSRWRFREHRRGDAASTWTACAR